MEKHKQKILPGRYQVAPRTLIFIKNDDELLLIKGAKDKKIWPGLYNGIGGHVERGEDALSAAHRELFEETGLENTQLDLRAIIFIDVEEYQGISLFVFFGNSEQTGLVSSEEGIIEWIKIDQIQNYPMVEDLYQLIPLVLSTEKRIQFGRYYYHDRKLVMEFNK